MRRVLVSLLLITGCKAGDVASTDPGLAKPVEVEQPAGGVPMPGEGAASPTTPAPVTTPESADPWRPVDPADTPTAGPESTDDPWPETSSDPWAPAATREEVTATPALPETTATDPANTTDPWTPTSTDPWATTKDPNAKKKPAPIR